MDEKLTWTVLAETKLKSKSVEKIFNRKESRNSLC